MMQGNVVKEHPKVHKEFIAVDVPLSIDEVQKLKSIIWYCDKMCLPVDHAFFVFPNDTEILILTLVKKDTNALISPIKGFRINSEESAVFERLQNNQEREYFVMPKRTHMALFLATKDLMQSLIDLAETEWAKKNIRTPGYHEMYSFLRVENARDAINRIHDHDLAN
jgi:hypothetical protein